MHLRATGVTFAFLLALLIPALVMGQNATGAGTVTGRVTDATGAIVTDATVTLTDTETGITNATASNNSGIYIFEQVKPGIYTVEASKPGFRKSVVAKQEVTPAAALTLNFALEVGAVTETVQVQASAEAELQTLNSTMGSDMGGATIMNLPTINRDVAGLVFLQATSSPTFNGAEGNITSGQIAGNPSDQNTYLLDGGNNTDDMDGDRGTYVGSRSGVVPTPVESVEEFRVNTNNMTADFATSGGGQVIVTTKRGTNQFHGSAYDFFQSSDLAANDFYNNFYDEGKPASHYNRFGGSIGGPLLPDFLGGKTYFYTNYEGERYPRSGPLYSAVPSDLLREGIFQIRDTSGNIVQYNLATSSVCGTNGNTPCDPRGTGMSPAVSTLWNKYMPQPTSPICPGVGDGLNTECYAANLAYPLSTNFAVVRVDHDFGSKWRFFSSYRYFSEDNPTTNQVDIGGIVSGDKLGVPASQSSFPLEPRYFVSGITTTITPSLNNEFHFSYTKNFWQWDRLGAGNQQLPGVPAAINMPGDAGQGSDLVPMNDDTQNTRPRLWDGHDYDFRDGLSWLRGTHLFQFGGDYLHNWFHFDRYDNVSGLLTQPKYLIGSSGIEFPTSTQPIACTSSVTTNCLPSSQLSNYESYYAMIAGMIQQAGTIATRTGSDLALNPAGTPMRSYSTLETYSLYFTDAWRIKPTLTLSYGLNYSIPMPPYELNRAQNTLVDANNNPLTIQNYLANRQSAAQNGGVYNPTIGFSPITDVGLKYPYAPYYGGLAPRVAIAWNPNFGDGALAKIFGNKNTVIRAGYGRFYSKTLGIDQVSTPVLGDGFLNPVSCVDPSMSGACAGPSGVTPSTAFRLGVDGNVSPFPTIAPTLQSPVQPGVNAPYEGINFFLDNNFKPASSDQIDVSIQRQLKGNYILEVGYVGVWARNLYQGIDLNDVPWMTKLGGQTFAQAYTNLYDALAVGKTPGVQPFLESALGGSPYCKGFSSCTAAVASNESGNILGQYVTNLWQDLEGSWSFTNGATMPATNQCQVCYGEASVGYSNYNSMVVTVQKRMSSGLTLNANFTYGKALGILALNQSYVENNVNDPWNLRTDYGPQFWDRKAVFNLLATYNLPLGKGQRWANSNPVATRVLGGWSISPILSMATGTPLDVYTGSYQEMGNGYVGNGCQAIPLSTMSYNTSSNQNIVSNGGIGANNDVANGGTGVNLYSNPTAVFNNFRPFILGTDGSCGGGGQLRGQNRWNLDLGLTKDTIVTERVGFQIYVQAFNALNHMMYSDPYMSLQDPGAFGALTNQYNALTLGGSGASANYTRIIQLGLRLRF
ncbi:MAG: carboxypeptidase regulatory-like domain-containing protein [Bryobacteraceae bacterium]|jgi:hypothetical protein